MKLKDAEKLAEQIMEQIRPFCDRLVVAGSIRRKKSEVRDVDFVLIPQERHRRQIESAIGQITIGR